MWNAFKTWNMREVMKERECSDDAKRFHQAMAAEDDLAQVVSALGHTSSNIHLRKRVYVPSQDRCREIDVIAVCDALYVVEVKNWSGSVWRNNDKWFQLPPARNAVAIQFGDLVEEVNFKAAALVRFLSVNHRITLPQGSVRAVLVFTRDGVTLDPKTVGNHPQVFTLETFKALVGQRHAAWDFFTYYAPFIAGKAELTPDVRDKVSKALETLKTWDVVTMHDGTRHNGDILRVVLPEITTHRPTHGGGKVISFERQQIAAMTLAWSSSSWWGFAQSLWQGSAGTVAITLAKGAVCPVATSGDSASASATPSRHTSSSSRATTTNARVQNEGDFVLTVPLTFEASKKSAKPEATNHLVLRPAGKASTETIPLALVGSLQFNRR